MKAGRPGFDVLAQLAALRRYAWSLTRDQSRAEDLVHDALLRAYEGRRSFRSDGDLRRWLLSILHNTFVNDVRRRRAEEARIREVAGDAEPTAPPQQEERVRLAEIRDAFFALPEDQRAALHLVTIEGLSYQEAADTLGIPVGTLMSRLGRARAALRAYEHEGGDGARSDRAGRHPPESGPRFRLVGGSDDPAG